MTRQSAQRFLLNTKMGAVCRLLIFIAIFVALSFVLISTLFRIVSAFGYEVPDTLNVADFLIADGGTFVSVLFATYVMSRIEGRSFAEYGIRFGLGRRFWIGFLWGTLAPSAVGLLIYAFHGYSLGSVALQGPQIVGYAAAWLIACMVLGWAEECLFRGYPQFTLMTALGFWPSVLFMSFGFGALHYFTKPYERWTDFLSTGLLGLFVCLTLRRTGDLRFAIGFHAAFDYANFFLISGKNGGQFASGRLFNAVFAGPDWLTGGQLGPEASLMVFPVLAALFLLFHRVYPTARFPITLENTCSKAAYSAKNES